MTEKRFVEILEKEANTQNESKEVNANSSSNIGDIVIDGETIEYIVNLVTDGVNYPVSKMKEFYTGVFEKIFEETDNAVVKTQCTDLIEKIAKDDNAVEIGKHCGEALGEICQDTDGEGVVEICLEALGGLGEFLN